MEQSHHCLRWTITYEQLKRGPRQAELSCKLTSSRSLLPPSFPNRDGRGHPCRAASKGSISVTMRKPHDLAAFHPGPWSKASLLLVKCHGTCLQPTVLATPSRPAVPNKICYVNLASRKAPLSLFHPTVPVQTRSMYHQHAM